MFKDIKLDLSNKYIFIVLSILLIFILTFINNYYFYEHVERTSSRQAVQLERLLINHIKLNNLKEKDILGKELLSVVNEWKENSYYNNGIEIIDFDGKSYTLTQLKKWDKSAYTFIIINFDELYNKKENGFILNSKTDLKEVFYSVFKSMTFSVTDIYEDITKKVLAKNDGQIIKIEDRRDNKYDGIISINGETFKDIKGAKNIVIRENPTLNEIEFYIPPYNELKVTQGMYIKKGEVLSQGTIYTAINNLENIYWYRSRPFLGFTIFTLLILFLFKKRTELLDRKRREIEEKAREEKEEARIREEKLKEKAREEKEKAREEAIKKQEEYEKEIDKIIKEKEKDLEKQNKLEEEYKSVCNQFKQYESFVKFAFNDISIDELLDRNRRILGNMFRLVAEKIVFSIFENEVRPISRRIDTLDSCLSEIKTRNILKYNSISALYAVKNFGNENSHYTRDENETSYAKTIVIAKDLINVIEEYLPIEEEYLRRVDEKKQNDNKRVIKNFKKGI